MALLDDLKTATNALDASVVALTARIAAQPVGGSVPDANVAAAIADINSQTAAVNALLAPPPPAPAA